MIPVETAFPAVHVCVSAVLVAAGLWMLLRRTRRRVGREPRCHRCKYILLGITAERCPECGTVIDQVRHSAPTRRVGGGRSNVSGF